MADTSISYCLEYNEDEKCVDCLFSHFPHPEQYSEEVIEKCEVPSDIQYEIPLCQDYYGDGKTFPDCDCANKDEGNCDEVCRTLYDENGHCDTCKEGYFPTDEGECTVIQGDEYCFVPIFDEGNNYICNSYCLNSNYEIDNQHCQPKVQNCLRFNLSAGINENQMPIFIAKCVQCSIGYGLNSEGKCEKIDNDKLKNNLEYCLDIRMNGDALVCEHCIRGSYSSNGNCARCQSSYIASPCNDLQGPQCSCNSDCYYNTNETCVESHCTMYDEFRNCLRCEKGYVLDESFKFCLNETIDELSSIHRHVFNPDQEIDVKIIEHSDLDSKQCQQGYFMEDGECVECSRDCITCLNETVCLTRVYEMLTTDGTKSCAQESCLECANHDPSLCIRCADGYHFNGWKCISDFTGEFGSYDYHTNNYLVDGLVPIMDFMPQLGNTTAVPHYHLPYFIDPKTYECKVDSRNVTLNCECPVGQYSLDPGSKSSFCNYCPDNCYKCLDSSICVECHPTAVMGSNGQCNCPEQMFFSPTEKWKCEHCPDFCSKCSSFTSCKGCVGLNRNASNLCQCEEGFDYPYDVDSGEFSCKQLPEGCKQQGHYKWNGANYICTECDLEGFSLDDDCTLCLAGYYPTPEGVCLPCSEECETCSSKDACTSCKGGVSLEKNCTACPDYTYARLNNSTNPSECEGRIFDPECYTCVSGDIPECLEYSGSGNSQVCQKCDLNITDEESLKHFVISNCSCEEGYMFITIGETVECRPCENINSLCSLCETTRQQANKYISPTCLQCQNDDIDPATSCTLCKNQSTYIDSGKCVDCIHPCKTCSAKKTCLTCIDEAMTGSDCNSCAAGTYMDADKHCQPCPVNCATCESDTNCTSCKSSYSNLETTDLCRTCSDGYFYHDARDNGIDLLYDGEDRNQLCHACPDVPYLDKCYKCELREDTVFCLECQGENVNPEPIDGVCGCLEGYFNELYTQNSGNVRKLSCSACNQTLDANGDFIFSRWCSVCNDTHCLNCTDSTTEPNGSDCSCIDGYFLTDAGFCAGCGDNMDHCALCNDRTTCLQCEPPYEFINGTCSGTISVVVLLVIVLLSLLL